MMVLVQEEKLQKAESMRKMRSMIIKGRKGGGLWREGKEEDNEGKRRGTENEEKETMVWGGGNEQDNYNLCGSTAEGRWIMRRKKEEKLWEGRGEYNEKEEGKRKVAGQWRGKEDGMRWGREEDK
jgi:hypothetical protein